MMIQIFKDLLTINFFPMLLMLFLAAMAIINYQKNRIKKYQRSIYHRMLQNKNYRHLKNASKQQADKLFFNAVEPKILKMASDFFDAKLTDQENFDQQFINTYLS